MNQSNSHDWRFNLGETAKRITFSLSSFSIDIVKSKHTPIEILDPSVMFVLSLDDHVTPSSVNGRKFSDIYWPKLAVGMIPSSTHWALSKPDGAEYMLIRMKRHFINLMLGYGNYSMQSMDRPVFAHTDPIAANIGISISLIVNRHRLHGDHLLLDTLSTSLAARMLQWSHGEAHTPHQESLTTPRMHRVLNYIEENLHRQIRLDELSGVAAMSIFHFSRAFKKEMGVTPVQHVWRRRIERTSILMRNKELPLSVIAFDCGFSSQSHFTTVFKRETGITPSQYRAQL